MWWCLSSFAIALERRHSPASVSKASPGERRRRERGRRFERSAASTGAGRIIERRFGLWLWKTWASEQIGTSRFRYGWALRFSRALTATEDALDDYELFPAGKY
jgi:hypothetical protein